jgi:hypothetical protein
MVVRGEQLSRICRADWQMLGVEGLFEMELSEGRPGWKRLVREWIGDTWAVLSWPSGALQARFSSQWTGLETTLQGGEAVCAGCSELPKSSVFLAERFLAAASIGTCEFLFSRCTGIPLLAVLISLFCFFLGKPVSGICWLASGAAFGPMPPRSLQSADPSGSPDWKPFGWVERR